MRSNGEYVVLGEFEESHMHVLATLSNDGVRLAHVTIPISIEEHYTELVEAYSSNFIVMGTKDDSIYVANIE